MKGTLLIRWDSRQDDMGVISLVDQYRDLFDQLAGREQIASTMTRILEGRRGISRQMVEKWFVTRKGRRAIPSSVLLIALLAACERIREQQRKAA